LEDKKGPDSSAVDQAWLDHVRDASHQASQDFDALVAKLGTAGLTVAVAVAGFTDAARWGFLIASGIAFALAMGCALLSIRLSADALRQVSSGKKRYEDLKAWKWVRGLNWAAFVLVFAGYLLLSLHLFDATVRTVTPSSGS
jgi:small-conductance mechanosensitive channel